VQFVFEEIELTPDLMLRADGEGCRITLCNLEAGRIGVGAQSVGIAQAAYEGRTRLRL
jgi:alkylation response protein AidB-like acyl-CoA dehydrogenase